MASDFQRMAFLDESPACREARNALLEEEIAAPTANGKPWRSCAARFRPAAKYPKIMFLSRLECRGQFFSSINDRERPGGLADEGSMMLDVLNA